MNISNCNFIQISENFGINYNTKHIHTLFPLYKFYSRYDCWPCTHSFLYNCVLHVSILCAELLPYKKQPVKKITAVFFPRSSDHQSYWFKCFCFFHYSVSLSFWYMLATLALPVTFAQYKIQCSCLLGPCTFIWQEHWLPCDLHPLWP